MRTRQTDRVRRIGGKKGGAAAGTDNRRDARFAAFRIASDDGHFRTGGRQTFRERAAEDARGTDDDSRFIAQIEK
jgi:hypothetical protein